MSIPTARSISMSSRRRAMVSRGASLRSHPTCHPLSSADRGTRSQSELRSTRGRSPLLATTVDGTACSSRDYDSSLTRRNLRRCRPCSLRAGIRVASASRSCDSCSGCCRLAQSGSFWNITDDLCSITHLHYPLSHTFTNFRTGYLAFLDIVYIHHNVSFLQTSLYTRENMFPEEVNESIVAVSTYMAEFYDELS